MEHTVSVFYFSSFLSKADYYTCLQFIPGRKYLGRISYLSKIMKYKTLEIMTKKVTSIF